MSQDKFISVMIGDPGMVCRKEHCVESQNDQQYEECKNDELDRRTHEAPHTDERDDTVKTDEEKKTAKDDRRSY